MPHDEEQSAEVKIANRMGLHVRPVQRFAEFARAFEADVEVHLRGRKVPGKSVIHLMSLGGRYGDTVRIVTRGGDARQCLALLRFLAENAFFVEDHADVSADTQRHLTRLAGLSSCFCSDVVAVLNGGRANAKDVRALAALGLTPRSGPTFEISGPDSEQARTVLTNLVEQCFYVEEEMTEKSREATE